MHVGSACMHVRPQPLGSSYNRGFGQHSPSVASATDGPPLASAMSWVEAAAAARILSWEDAPGGRGRTPDRLPQGPPPENYPGKWKLPAGWKDNGGPISELRFGQVTPTQAMLDGVWNLGWLLPPAAAAAAGPQRLRPLGLENILLQDLRWELIIHHVCGRMGGDHLRSYRPRDEVPTIDVMIDRLIKAGFSASALADGSQSHLGAWALDVLWTEVHVWAGLQQPGTKLCPVPNETYVNMAMVQAAACGMELWELTNRFCNGVTRSIKIGNIIETYAIWLLKEARWEDMATLVLLLAKSDRYLAEYLAMTTTVSLDSSEGDIDEDAMAPDSSADEAARAGAAAAARGAEPAREREPEPEPVATAWARAYVPPKPEGDVQLVWVLPGAGPSAKTEKRKEKRIRQYERWLSQGRPAASRPSARDPRLEPGENHPTFEEDPTYAYVAPEAAASAQRPAATAAARARSRSQYPRAAMGMPSGSRPS